jgi:Icc-related predicted phosphoesterase
MRIQLLSDLHFEFHRDGGAALVADCFAPADVLVLAGDIAVAEGIAPALTLFSERYPQVVYVHGNHEFYGSTRSVVAQLTREACARLGNVHWLDGDVVELGGQRFLGAPLWFAESDGAKRYQSFMNDFAQIEGFHAWVYSEHARARAFFEAQLRAGDVVVTHHLPTWASVPARFRGNPLNCYFVADVEPLIHERGPALWMHGHTHDVVDLVVGSTRVLCNPFGYVGVEENPAFNEKYVIDLAAR